ncbi:MAG: glutathionylspermidine synthase family protein [Rothia sp. (in: high G+C Gram-positive bacteria)]|nr:glutathionylspermidine synthase family protein [Rothia sp. (in: high G+C Gram-positive bacteria)]
MRRLSFSLGRQDWEQTIAREGLIYSLEGPEDTDHYWNEFAAYEFSVAEALWIQEQVEQAHQMCLAAIDHIISGPLKYRLGLSEQALKLAIDSWRWHEYDFYGRFDFIYNPDQHSLKLLEYNADTPTGLVETAVSQSSWFKGQQMAMRGYKEWNDLGHAFAARWAQIKKRVKHPVLHLACVNPDIDELGEDLENLKVVAHAASMAGWETHLIYIDDLRWKADSRIWQDGQGRRVYNLFKLYPWEDMVEDAYGQVLFEGGYQALENWFEPAWKMFLSNKVLLQALWELYPNHPLLLPTSLEADHGFTDWVKKPIFGREGDGIVVEAPSYGVQAAHTDGYMTATAREDEYIYQQYVHPPSFSGQDQSVHYPVLGAWVVGGKAMAFGVRESDGAITDGYCRFVSTVLR